VYAVNPADGTEIWRVQPDGPVAGSPVASGGLVYFATEAGTVYARQTGGSEPVWEQIFEGKIYTDPLLVGETLLVAHTGGPALLTALNASSGATRWSFTPAG
jgi:outer membrane protein assembly factor BamB